MGPTTKGPICNEHTTLCLTQPFRSKGIANTCCYQLSFLIWQPQWEPPYVLHRQVTYLTASYPELPSSCWMLPFILCTEVSLLFQEYFLEVLLFLRKLKGIQRTNKKLNSIRQPVSLLFLLSLGEFSSLCCGPK